MPISREKILVSNQGADPTALVAFARRDNAVFANFIRFYFILFFRFNYQTNLASHPCSNLKTRWEAVQILKQGKRFVRVLSTLLPLKKTPNICHHKLECINKFLFRFIIPISILAKVKSFRLIIQLTAVRVNFRKLNKVIISCTYPKFLSSQITKCRIHELINDII